MYFTAEVEKLAVKFSSPPFSFDGCFVQEYREDEYYKLVLLNAFSIALPSGEKFFIDSLKRHLSDICSQEHKDFVRVFVMQEAVHSKYHTIYNKTFCKENGYSLKRLEAPFLFNSGYVTSNNTKKYCLALTVCLEHLTAVASEAILKNDWLSSYSPRIEKFWKWHALEEIDHRSVAFDIFRSIYDDKIFLDQVMREVCIKFSRFLEITMCAMVSHDEQDTKKLKSWLRNSDFMTGEHGVIPYFMNLIDRFFESDFHPKTHFDNILLESLLLVEIE